MDIKEKYNNDEYLYDYEEDIDAHETKSIDKIRKKDDKINRRIYDVDLITNITALGKYLSDKKVQWYKKSVVIGVLAYYIRPQNSLPNWKEFFLFLDDVGAIEWAVRFLGKELEKYY